MLRNSFFFLIILSITGFPTLLKGQQDSEAKHILDTLIHHLQDAQSFSTSFTLHIQNPEKGVNASQQGTFRLKGNWFRVNMGEWEVACNGETTYWYQEETHEILVEEYSEEGEAMFPMDFLKRFRSDFSTHLLKRKHQRYYLLELIPQMADSKFLRVNLRVDRDSYTLVGYEFWNRSGTHYSYLFQNPQFNVDIPNSYFKLDTTAHPGAKVTDTDL